MRLFFGALCLSLASVAQAAVKISVDWDKAIAVSKTTPTLIACPFRPIPGATPPTSVLHDAEFSVLRELNAKYVRWHLINASRQVAEIEPPTKEKTSWDFSRLDEDMLPFLEATKGKGQEPIVNFTLIPYWMFKTGEPIPRDSNLDDPNLLRGKYLQATSHGLVDPTGTALGDYFARIVSWYTQGGFTDENGVYHRSGHYYDLPWWGVLNELDVGIPPEQYTLFYDAIVSAIQAVNPKTKFVGLSNGLPSLNPEYFEYFLNPRNHRPGIPLDMIAYHFYAGAWALGGSSEDETLEHWQYTFFDQAAAFLSTVRYIESIRKRLSPTTRVNLDELGAFLTDDAVTEGHPEKAKPVPPLYWNLNGAVFAYLYAELAKMGIDVATISGIYDRPHGLPGHIPSITFIDPTTGELRAPLRVLRLIRNKFGPGDKLVSTDPPAEAFALVSRSDVVAQGFVTAKGKRLLIINKRLRDADVDLAGIGVIGKIEVVDAESRGGPIHRVKPTEGPLHLGSFAVAVVEIQ